MLIKYYIDSILNLWHNLFRLEQIYRGLGEDMKIIIKSAAPLSFVVLLVMGGVSLESQANGDKDLFLSNKYGETLAFNSMRGKPPYNRSKMNRQRRQNQNLQSVEMSALEIDQGSAVAVPSQVTRKSARGGHPDRSKRYGYR